jgi:CspA family cold shock protein
MEDGVRVMGTVQWFSRVKGYGFIRPDDQEEDVFVHYSAIRGEGYRNLNEDQRVEFTMEDTPKGPQAVDVVGIDEEAVEFAAGDTLGDTPKEPQAVDVVGIDEEAVEFAAGDTLGDILEESPTVRAIEIDEE